MLSLRSPFLSKRFQRIINRVVCWIFWLVLGVWLLFGGLLLLLHLWVLPNLQSFKPWLERQASQSVGTSVRIQTIDSVPNGLFPVVRLRGVIVAADNLAAAQQSEVVNKQTAMAPGLVIDEVVATISPRILWFGEMEQLVLKRPQLQVVQTSNSVLALGQRFDIPKSNMQTAWYEQEMPIALKWLMRQPEVVVLQGELRWRWCELKNTQATLKVDLNSIERAGEKLNLISDFTCSSAPLNIENPSPQERVDLIAKENATNPQLNDQEWIFDDLNIVLRSAGLTQSMQWRLQTKPTIVLNQESRVDGQKLNVRQVKVALGPIDIRVKLKRQHVVGSTKIWPRVSGKLFVQAEQLDLQALQPVLNGFSFFDTSDFSARGVFGARAWFDVKANNVEKIVTDIALQDTQIALPSLQKKLSLDRLQVRLSSIKDMSKNSEGWYIASHKLNFSNQSVSWQKGDFRAKYNLEQANNQKKSFNRKKTIQLQIDHANLAALTALLTALQDKNQPASINHALKAPILSNADGNSQYGLQELLELAKVFDPSGYLEDIVVQWQQTDNATPQWHVKSQLHNLRWGMRPRVSVAAVPFGAAGLSGLIQFDNQNGYVDLSIKNGWLNLPTVFEQALIPVKSLTGRVYWQHDQDGQLRVYAPQMQVNNADLHGHAKFLWRTYTDEEVRANLAGGISKNKISKAQLAQQRYPGVLELSGALTKISANKVVRYLPLTIGEEVRYYLKEAVQDGHVPRINFEVNGSLAHLPFDSQSLENNVFGKATFRIAAQLKRLAYQYMPRNILEKSFYRGEQRLVWPDLFVEEGQLNFIGNSMKLEVNKGHLKVAPDVHLSKGFAVIDDLNEAYLRVNVGVQGQAKKLLDQFASSPGAAMTDFVLDDLSVTGDALLDLELGIRLSDVEQKHTSFTRGNVQLTGNDLSWWRSVPRIQQAHGSISFDDEGFSIEKITGTMLGGPVEISAQTFMPNQNATKKIVVKVDGTMHASELNTHLRHAVDSVQAQALANHFSGSTDYSAQVVVQQGKAFVNFSSDTKGLISTLPAPLQKSENEIRALSLQHQPATNESVERWRLAWGDGLLVDYQYPLSGTVHGNVFLGDFSKEEKKLADFTLAHFPHPHETGKNNAYIRLEKLDAMAWYDVLFAKQTAVAQDAAQIDTDLVASFELFLPQVWNWDVHELLWDDHKLHNAQIQVLRKLGKQNIWLTRIKAKEIEGMLEYHPEYAQSTGLIRGMFKYLELDGSTVDEELVPPQNLAQQEKRPHLQKLPALDIEVERFVLNKRDWGKLSLQALNRSINGESVEWRINHLTLDMPQAHFQAKGTWTDVPPNAKGDSAQNKRVALDFNFDINDTGGLLKRLGQADLIHAGVGNIQGSVEWLGSPINLDIPSLGGSFKLNIEKGQFLQADAGLGRLLGVVSLSALARRFKFDFRDIFSKGFAFDVLSGEFFAQEGKLRTRDLRMQGVNAVVWLEGEADLIKKTQDVRAVIVPEINAMTASLAAAAFNPAVGAATFLAQLLFSKELSSAATREFHIQGTWADPVVERIETGKDAMQAAGKT